MTRRSASREATFRAAEAYRRRFGEAPPTRRFMARPAELARELQAAVRGGEPVTEAELRERLGVAPPPPGAEL